MYCREVTNKFLRRAESNLGFKPEYHSVDEVKRDTAYLRDLFDPEAGQLTRKLHPDEERWVRNEHVLCQCDYTYWATRYAVILDWQGQLRQYQPNVAQRILWDIRAETQRTGRTLATINLKARQLGVSTDMEMVVAHRVQFWPNTNAVVASCDPEKSRQMAQMMERCWEHQPWFLMPKITGYQKGEAIEFGRQSSAVSIQWGNQFTGIARGSTPTVCHLSEVSEFNNPRELVDASLLRAMHDSPWMFLALESTAKGRHNWWHKSWNYAKAHWAEGTSRLRPTFLPWYVGTDLYPTGTWLRTHPIPRNWEPAELTHQHAERAKAYVRSNDVLRRYLGDDWEMPREQRWFWEVTRQEYAEKGDLATFHTELCADDTEAFQSSGISVFDSQLVSDYRERTRPPLGVFALQGPEVPPELKPDRREIDRDMPTLHVSGDYRLIPLRFRDFTTFDPEGKFLLWEFPEPGEKYGLGVDTSGGVGRDRSVIEVLRKGTLHRNDCQVAEFASSFLNAKQLLSYVHVIGDLYSDRSGETVKQAKLVIEVACGGNLLQLDLRKMGWTNFHRWLRGYDARVLDPSRSNTLGWQTTQWSRNTLIVNLMEYLRAAWLEINSPYFVDEMGDFEADEVTQKMKAAYGAFDDRIIAVGMVLLSLHDIEIVAKRPSIARQRAIQANADEEPAPKWKPPSQYVGRGVRVRAVQFGEDFDPYETEVHY